jgi:hypothetical protein
MKRAVLSILLALSRIAHSGSAQTQSPSQSGTSASTNARNSPATQTTCTDNGTYVNGHGQKVERPENCSSAPQGATAQCRDGTYSFSRTRRGTCSHHGRVAKWLR